MAFKYDKLWNKLKKLNITKKELILSAKINSETLSKLSKNKYVSLKTIDKLCEFFECNISEIMEYETNPYTNNKVLGTFKPNKAEFIHRWFSYTEGYSKTLVETELNKIGKIDTLFDPFGGSGTSLLVASEHGITSFFCETNPVMTFICNTKINTSKKISGNISLFKNLQTEVNKIISFLTSLDFPTDFSNIKFGGFEKYYNPQNLYLIMKTKEYINNVKNSEIKDILKLALASIAIETSKMIRRGDLRFAKGKEIDKVNKNFLEKYKDKLNEILYDIKQIKFSNLRSYTKMLSYDARNIDSDNLVDAIITSPPYLNGTNYIRNTKLELKLLDFINNEKDLTDMHSIGIISGINNVSKRKGNIKILDEIKDIYNQLNEVTYDPRIPVMVAGYFYDMNNVFNKLYKILKTNGIFIMDIGDSQFAGIHVKTHEILIKLALKNGFKLYESEIIRKRYSNKGFELSQRIIRFRKVQKG